MPWHKETRDGKVCVVKDSDGSTAGCHDTAAKADAQIAALYANEPKAASITVRLAANARDVSVSAEGETSGLAGDTGAAEPCCPECAERDAKLAYATGPFDEPFPVPSYPPASWFDKPEWLQPGQGLTITDDGQVAGYFYERGTCLLGGGADCWQPPPSPTHYAAFHQQDVVVEGGETLRVGVIGNVGGHASPAVNASTAARHYADPNCVKIVARAGDDEHGAWVAGSLVDGLTYRDVALVRRAALSGDWRGMDDRWWVQAGVSRHVAAQAGYYDCIGPTFVNRPGLPLLKAYQPAKAASAAPPVYLGGLGGVEIAEEMHDSVDVEAYDLGDDPTPAKVADMATGDTSKGTAPAAGGGTATKPDPNKPHAFVDDNGDGKCDICSKPAFAHGGQASVHIEIPVPDGVDPEDFVAKIAAAIPEAQAMTPEPTVDEKIAALDIRVAAAEETAKTAEDRAIAAELALLDAEAEKLKRQ